MILPVPRFYVDWKAWAQALVKVLSQETVESAVNAPSYHSTLVPAKGKPGDLIYVSNTDKLAYWKATTSLWRYVDESGNV